MAAQRLHLLFSLFIYWPILLTLLTITYVIKYTIKLSARFLRPDFGRMLSGTSALLATDSFDTRPSGTLIPCFLFDGVLDFKHLQRNVEKELNTENSQELRQTLTKWFGFYFWKNDPNFDLKNHLIELKAPVRSQEIPKIERDLSSKPFPPNKPLWEMILYSNVIPQTNNDTRQGTQERLSVLIFRVHHCMADGYSIMKLWDRICRVDADRNSFLSSLPKPNIPRRPVLEKLRYYLSVIHPGPVLAIKSFTKFHKSRGSIWYPKPQESDQDYMEDWSEDADFHEVRAISKSFKVPSSAVIFSAYAGAIRKLMLEKGERVLEEFLMSVPFPLPGHPDHPTNHMMMVHFYPPMNIADPVQRLRAMNDCLQDLRTSPVTFHNHLFAKLAEFFIVLGLIPRFAISHALMNNFPGPTEVNSLVGVNMLNLSLGGGIPLGFQNAMLCSHTYGKRLSLRVILDKIMYQDETLPEKILKWTTEEIKLLHSSR